MIVNRINTTDPNMMSSISNIADGLKYKEEGKTFLYTGETSGTFEKNCFYKYTTMNEWPMYKIMCMTDLTNIWYVFDFVAGTPIYHLVNDVMTPDVYIVSELETVDLDGQKQWLCTIQNSQTGTDVGIWVSDWFPITETKPKSDYTYKEQGSGHWIKVDIQ